MSGIPNTIAESARNKWLLIERDLRLLLMGKTPFSGVSVRRSLDHVGRNILLPAITAALRQELEDGENAILFEGETWLVETEVILSPVNQTVIAGLARYRRPDDLATPRPLIGAWEWEVQQPSEDGTSGVMRSFWDANLFTLYQTAPESTPTAGAAFDAPTWFNEVLVPADRARLKATIDEGITAVTPELHTLSYSVQVGYGTEITGIARMRLAGRAYRDSGSSTVWLRGITHEIEQDILESTPGLEEVSGDDFLRATLELADDVALCAVDTRFWHVYLTSPGWAFENLASAGNGALINLVHPKDYRAAMHFLLAAVERREVQGEPIIVQLLNREGSWSHYALKATGVTAGSTGNRYAFCRMRRI